MITYKGFQIFFSSVTEIVATKAESTSKVTGLGGEAAKHEQDADNDSYMGDLSQFILYTTRTQSFQKKGERKRIKKPGSALGKEGSGKVEPASVEILRSRKKRRRSLKRYMNICSVQAFFDQCAMY
ncbi:unnamed protein product [Brassica rapa subsp. narinosa]